MESDEVDKYEEQAEKYKACILVLLFSIVVNILLCNLLNWPVVDEHAGCPENKDQIWDQ